MPLKQILLVRLVLIHIKLVAAAKDTEFVRLPSLPIISLTRQAKVEVIEFVARIRFSQAKETALLRMDSRLMDLMLFKHPLKIKEGKE